MTYKPSGVTVNILDNPLIVSITGAARLPAIVGFGPTTRTVVDEAVVRASSGYVDYLANYPAAGVNVSQIAESAGVVSGSLSAVFKSLNGSLYNHTASASINANGAITWLGSNTDIPSTGSIYYVRYTYNVPSTQYDPVTLSDKGLVLARYGAENATTGILSIAGSIALENGAPAVTLVQASGSVYSEVNYKAAIDKLQKKSNIEQLIVVFPSGSVTRAQQETLLTYAMSHINLMSGVGKERGLICGSPSSYFAQSGGFDSVGDASTDGSYVYRATALNNPDVTYAVPSRVRRKDANGNYMELDGNFAAIMIAGLEASQALRTTPMHGKAVTGVEIENEKWTDFEMNRLGGAGCLVLESKSGVITIRDAITTDGTSADTEEIAIRAGRRLVTRTLRDVLQNVYTSKGKVITTSTIPNIIGTIHSTLGSLQNQGEIVSYGQTDDPLTGETKITAKQNTVEPRQIDAACSIKFPYALKWIVVNVSTYV